MVCPFCGKEMRRGWIRVAGFGLYPWVSSIVWQADERPRSTFRLSFGRQKRTARCCPACGAVVVSPPA